jgi:hypothetical protein
VEENKMPYGMPKELGGDSPENDSWMERCVKRVSPQKDKEGKEYGKDKAIAICKSTFTKMKGNKSNAEVEIAFMLDWDKRLTRS